MRNLIFNLLAISLFLIISENSISQTTCPPLYDGPHYTIVYLCPPLGCPVEVEWCCFTGIGPTVIPSIHIGDIRFLSDPGSMGCACLQWINQQPPLSAVPVIPFSTVLDRIFKDGKGCFLDGPPNIPLCGDSRQLIFKITMGGCYTFDYSYENWGFKVCGVDIGECHQGYELCYELVNGVYKLKATPLGYSIPNYTCPPGCQSICDFLNFSL